MNPHTEFWAILLTTCWIALILGCVIYQYFEKE